MPTPTPTAALTALTAAIGAAYAWHLTQRINNTNTTADFRWALTRQGHNQ